MFLIFLRIGLNQLFSESLSQEQKKKRFLRFSDSTIIIKCKLVENFQWRKYFLVKLILQIL